MSSMTGRQLRKLRLARGTSTEAASREIGVSRRTWVRYESSRTIPPPIAKLITLLWQR